MLRGGRAPSSAKPECQPGRGVRCHKPRSIASSAAAASAPPSTSSTPISASRTAPIAAIGRNLAAGATEIDAGGKLVLPGGIDAHAHIEQLSAAGIVNADTFESATTAAAFGGTTTVICFAAQHRGMNLMTVVADYMALARKGAVIDYTFHMILTDPTKVTLEEHVPALVAQGHSTLKVFMTYDLLNVGDEGLLDILLAARRNKALVCVHAENHGMISWMGKKLVEKGYTAPKYHTVSHPRGCEAEAFTRLIAFAELIDQPIMIFHVSTAEGVEVIRRARGRGLKVFAETCPQYLFMTAKDLDKPGLEGAKWMCSPPPRTEADQEAIWQGLALGDLQVVSSDHAPYAFDASGKLSAGTNPKLQADRQRPARHRGAIAAAVRRHGLQGPARVGQVRRAHRHGAGQDLQSASAQGLDRHRRRRRPRDLGPQTPGDAGRRHAARPHRLYALRGAHGHGLARDGAAPRRGRGARR